MTTGCGGPTSGRIPVCGGTINGAMGLCPVCTFMLFKAERMTKVPMFPET